MSRGASGIRLDMQLLPGEEGCGRHRLYERRQAVPGEIAPLRTAVVRLAAVSGATTEQRERIALAVSEALTNCAQHAYAQIVDPGPVTVVARAGDGTLEVTISDEGHGMVPVVGSPGLGLGLSLMERVSEHVDIDGDPSDGDGVSVHMRFAIGSSS